MGSIEEEELNQMVRDYIEDESASVKSSRPSNHQQLTFLTNLQEILGKRTDDEAVIHERILMYVKNMGTREDQAKNLKKFVVMKLKMDGIEASLCKTSWVSTFNRLKVSPSTDGYEYIDVMIVDKNVGKATRLIIDMDFKSQFEVARPTTSYTELINILPSIFVGTEEKLNKIISLLCSAAKQSLKENNLHVPPWRKASYMQSKWLSKNYKKVSVSPNTDHMGSDKSEENISTTCCPSIFSRGAVKP